MTDENPAPGDEALSAEDPSKKDSAVRESSPENAEDDAAAREEEEFFSRKPDLFQAAVLNSEARDANAQSSNVRNSADGSADGSAVSGGEKKAGQEQTPSAKTDSGEAAEGSGDAGSRASGGGFHIDMDEVMEGLNPPKRKLPLFLRSGFLASLAGIGVSVYLLSGMSGELTYWLLASSQESAIEAGDAQNPKILDAKSGALVRLSGNPAGSAVRFKRRFVLREIVALKDVPIAVERNATNKAGKKEQLREAPPNLSPVNVRGRLLRDDALPPEYTEAFGMLASRRELIPEGGHFYLLIQDEVPRSGFQTPALGFALLALLFFNLRLFFRSLFGSRRQEED